MNHLVISDIHPGRWGRDSVFINKTALNAFANYALENNAEVIVNGDFDEHFLYSRGELSLKVVEKEFNFLKSALLEASEKYPVRFLRGNHDDPKMDADWIENNLGLPRDKFHSEIGLIYSPNPEIFITHGHILETGKHIRKFIREKLLTKSPGKALETLCENVSSLEQKFNSDVESLDKYIHPVMSNLRKHIRPAAEFLESSFFPLLINYIKKSEQAFHNSSLKKINLERVSLGSGMTQMAAEMAYAIDAKVAIIGHDHVSGIVSRWTHNYDKKILVGNSGSWIGTKLPRNALFIDSQKETLQLLEYNSRNNSVEVKMNEKY